MRCPSCKADVEQLEAPPAWLVGKFVTTKCPVCGKAIAAAVAPEATRLLSQRDAYCESTGEAKRTDTKIGLTALGSGALFITGGILMGHWEVAISLGSMTLGGFSVLVSNEISQRRRMKKWIASIPEADLGLRVIPKGYRA